MRIMKEIAAILAFGWAVSAMSIWTMTSWDGPAPTILLLIAVVGLIGTYVVKKDYDPFFGPMLRRRPKTAALVLMVTGMILAFCAFTSNVIIAEAVAGGPLSDKYSITMIEEICRLFNC